MITRSKLLSYLSLVPLCLVGACPVASAASSVLTGQAAFSDYSQEAPGVKRKLTVEDLPKPYATESARNGRQIVKRPENAWPKCPAGFKVDLYATKLNNPRIDQSGT